MLRIHVAPLGFGPTHERDWVLQQAARSPSPNYEVVTRPDRADAILLTDAPVSMSESKIDSRIPRLLAGQLLRRHRSRCFVYCDFDVPRPYLPGLFQNMEWFHGVDEFAVAIAPLRYFEVLPNAYMTDRPAPAHRDLLYSYRGRTSHPVRDEILRHAPVRDDVIVCDTTNLYHHFGSAQESPMQREYVEVMRRSRWAVCPRGWSTTSLRLFEAMRLGIAPVVIADNWLRPLGPDWDSCSLWVRESDAPKLADILEGQQDRWREMGAAAQAAWRQYFAPNRWFGTAATALATLLDRRRGTPFTADFARQSVELVRHWRGQPGPLMERSRQRGCTAFDMHHRSRTNPS